MSHLPPCVLEPPFHLLRTLWPCFPIRAGASLPHALMTYIYPNSLATSVASVTPSLNLHCSLRARTSPLYLLHFLLSPSPPLTPRGFTFAETFALLLGMARHELMQSVRAQQRCPIASFPLRGFLFWEGPGRADWFDSRACDCLTLTNRARSAPCFIHSSPRAGPRHASQV